MRLPVLGKLVARLAMPSNVYIAHEDRRVVITQQPKASGLKDWRNPDPGRPANHRVSPKARRFTKSGRETVTGGVEACQG